ncbi:MAG: ImmA/IrrE family metallo-endopeptidase [Anaerolineaceae bacterium]|nr:ImmA/IrrE family metallo-endopeptidase [Anaerolineaceae bacterium]
MPGTPVPDAGQRQGQSAAGRGLHRVEVKPELLQWACNRSGRSIEELNKRPKLKKLDTWLQGGLNPTFKQLEDFAKATYTPIGYFFLDEPPDEVLPVTDFRTVSDQEVQRPSPNLLDTLYLCQRRQDWYRREALAAGEPQLVFVGSLTTNDEIFESAAKIRDVLEFNIEQRRQLPNWFEALRHFILQAETSGILVMVNGVVGDNTHRKLDPEEFRGFALVDPVAPLIFINGADSKAAQMFTLAHEIAHVWLGQSGVSNSRLARFTASGIERWCNRVAAELLVPSRLIRDEYDKNAELSVEINRLARYFKVSTLVILRRIYDEQKINRDEFWSAYHDEMKRITEKNTGNGGNYHYTTSARASKRFARALIASALEGRTTLKEAMRLLGVNKMSAFMKVAKNLKVIR